MRPLSVAYLKPGAVGFNATCADERATSDGSSLARIRAESMQNQHDCRRNPVDGSALAFARRSVFRSNCRNNPDLQACVNFAVQVNLNGVETQFFERPLEPNLVLSE